MLYMHTFMCLRVDGSSHALRHETEVPVQCLGDVDFVIVRRPMT
jgi:hypothetical protein